MKRHTRMLWTARHFTSMRTLPTVKGLQNVRRKRVGLHEWWMLPFSCLPTLEHPMGQEQCIYVDCVCAISVQSIVRLEEDLLYGLMHCPCQKLRKLMGVTTVTTPCVEANRSKLSLQVAEVIVPKFSNVSLYICPTPSSLKAVLD